MTKPTGRPRGRPITGSAMETIPVFLTQEQLAVIDDARSRMPGKISRSGVVRMMVQKTIDESKNTNK